MLPTPGDVQAVLHTQTVSMIGLIFGTLLTGVLLTLGASSIFLLSSKGDRSLRGRNHFLCVYIIILSLAVLTFDAEVFVLGNGISIFFSQTPNKLQEFWGICGEAIGSTALFIMLLADGVFVWRCFMVQRALGPYNSSKWGNMLWVFPACLWILSLAIGITALVSSGGHNPSYPFHSDILGTIAIAHNSVLNVYATTFLTIRLLAHRKLVIACLGNKARTVQHLRIITILLESAVINVPITIATAIGLGTGKSFGEVNEFIVAPSQALASVIIIHQVALGRAFDQQREDELGIEVASESSLAHAPKKVESRQPQRTDV